MRDYEVTAKLKSQFTEIINRMAEESGWNVSDLSFSAHEALDDAFMDIYDKVYK